MLENKIETYLLEQVAEKKGHTRKLRFLERRGAPDRLVWIPGWSYPKLAEMKAPGKRLEDHQRREHVRLVRMGFYVTKLDTFNDVDKFLKLK